MNKVDVDKALATLRASDAELRAAASPGRRRGPRPGGREPGGPGEAGIEDFEPDFFPAEAPGWARGS